MSSIVSYSPSDVDDEVQRGCDAAELARSTVMKELLNENEQLKKRNENLKNAFNAVQVLANSPSERIQELEEYVVEIEKELAFLKAEKMKTVFICWNCDKVRTGNDMMVWKCGHVACTKCAHEKVLDGCCMRPHCENPRSDPRILLL